MPGDLGVRTCRVGEDGGLEKVRGATPPGGMEADGTCDKGTAVGCEAGSCALVCQSDSCVRGGVARGYSVKIFEIFFRMVD